MKWREQGVAARGGEGASPPLPRTARVTGVSSPAPPVCAAEGRQTVMEHCDCRVKPRAAHAQQGELDAAAAQ